MSARVRPAVQRGVVHLERAMRAHGWAVTVEYSTLPIATAMATIRVYDGANRVATIVVRPSERGGMGRSITVWPLRQLGGLYPRTLLTLGAAGALARRYARAAVADLVDLTGAPQ